MLIRKSAESDVAAIATIVNEAAQAYRGVIPADRWHEPYMPTDELKKEISAGVVFWVAEDEGRLLGVMGIQDKGDVALVRHAYVATNLQRSGVGTRLLRHVEAPHGQAHPDRHLGECVVGHRFLSAERIHRRPEHRQGSAAPDILVDPRATDRSVGCPCRWTMDGGPGWAALAQGTICPPSAVRCPLSGARAAGSCRNRGRSSSSSQWCSCWS